MGETWRKLLFLFRRRQIEQDLEEEMRYHAEMSGTPQFGNVTLLKENSRREWGFAWAETLAADLRFAARTLRKSPGFSSVVLLTLALGIGLNTLVFSVVNGALLRALPYRDPRQLVLVSEWSAEAPEAGLSYPVFAHLRDRSQIFSGIAGLGGHSLVLTGAGDPAEVRTVVVTSGLFPLLSAKPLLGRLFTHEEDQRGSAKVVILSESLWRTRFGADPGVIGRSIDLDRRAYSVIGVMPASFHTPFLNQPNQIWVPLAQDPLFSVWMEHPPQQHWMAVIARVRPGVSPHRMQAELGAFSANLATQYPDEKDWRLRTKSLQEAITGDVKVPMLVLLGAVTLLLLIACANVANLLLSRSASRLREVAIRTALGAGRGRIARQLFTECAILGLTGGVIGILVAYAGLAVVRPLLPADLPNVEPIRIDAHVVAFALLLSVFATILFGLAPALYPAASRIRANLAEGGRSGESSGPRRARAAVAVAEIGLAIVLSVAAGLLMRSFVNLASVNPGFAPAHVVKAMISLPQFQYATQQQWATFSDTLLSRLQAQPGLQDSAIAGPLPIVDCCISLSFQIDGGPAQRIGAANTADYVPASPGYFRVMGIPLLRGRLFTDSETASAPAVTVISEALAKRYFPNQNPLGKHLSFGFPANGVASREVVGVVADVQDRALGTDAQPMVYVPFAQAPLFGCEVVVKSTLSVSAVAAQIRDVTRGIDKNLPVTDVTALPEVVNASLAQPRFRASILVGFGAIALLLAGIGIFGVISYSVARRTQELGIRLALGAQRTAVARLVLRETMLLALLGVAIGIPSSIAMTRLFRRLLFHVTPFDPITLPLVALVLVGIAALASYIPARRATKVDPIIALRYE